MRKFFELPAAVFRFRNEPETRELDDGLGVLALVLFARLYFSEGLAAGFVLRDF